MKKIICLSLCCAFIMSVFSSCKNNEKVNTNQIRIWHDKEDSVAEIIQEKLNALSPDVEVILEKKSNLTEALKMVGNDKNSAPDMYIFAHDKIGVYAEMDILAPITDFIPKEYLTENYIPMTIEAATYKDNIYQLPIYFETLVFMYNKKYMKSDEVPKTTDELLEYMKNNTNGGHYGFVEQHSMAYYSAGWIHAFGGEIIDKNGTPKLDTKEVIDALTYHKQFVEYMPGESEYATINTLFNAGKAHSTISGPWLVPTARNSGIDVGIAPMPVVDSTGKSLAPFSGVQGIHVLKNAAEDKPEAVKKVLNALLDIDIGIDLAKASGCAPARLDCYETDEIKNDNLVMSMRKTAENAVPMPNIPEMDVMWTVTDNLLVSVNMSNDDVAESAKKQQEKALALINNMK